MIWRVVHSSEGFQFRSTTGHAWPDGVFTRTDDYGLPLIGRLFPHVSESDVAKDALAGSAASAEDRTDTKTKRQAA